jgi:signal transduction histidine kinase
MLFRAKDIDGESRGLVGKIANSAERMSLLIQDLLDFSSLVYDRAALEEVDLQVVVSRIVEDYELSLEEKQASISIGKLPKIEASALQMNQLFYNLLGNALKFTSKERSPVIDISSRSLDATEACRYISRPRPGITYHEIAVCDNGIGFAPEYASQIFEPFKRLHTRNAFPGSGIGLSLCQRIVKIHGGAIHSRSTAGSGSTFFVVLPNLSSGREAGM